MAPEAAFQENVGVKVDNVVPGEDALPGDIVVGGLTARTVKGATSISRIDARFFHFLLNSDFIGIPFVWFFSFYSVFGLFSRFNRVVQFQFIF